MSARVRTIEIVDMQRNGYSNEDIAKHFGITREEVKERLTRYDKQTKYYKYSVFLRVQNNCNSNMYHPERKGSKK